MIIDLSKIPLGYSENFRDEHRLKSGRLLNEIKKINQDMDKKYNFIIVPISVFNILECDDRFNSIPPSSPGLEKVGTLGDLEVYLDIYMRPDEILISWDKQTARDVKINNILNNVNSKELRIKIIH